MRKTLLLRAKPGSEEVEIMTNRLGQTIPYHIVRLKPNIWEMQGERTLSPRLHRKYMTYGLSFSNARKKQLVKRRGIRYTISPVTEAALNGQYEKIVNLLTKHLK